MGNERTEGEVVERARAVSAGVGFVPTVDGDKRRHILDLRFPLSLVAEKDAENEALRLAICGGEDAPGYAASLPLDAILRVLSDNYASWKRDSELAWDGDTATSWKSRALAAEARVEGLAEVARSILSADREAMADHRPKWGLADCVDNDGRPYQSQFLADALRHAASLLQEEQGHG